jgi:hypothetical protein
MKAVYLAVLLPVLASGCASLTGSEMQSVLVATQGKSGQMVEGAECALQSPKGLWKVKTPSSVTILRDSEDVQVNCQKEGQEPGLAKLISRVHGGMIGNIIFGGGIGAIVDHAKGTGYEYPNKVNVVMGESIVIDRKDEIAAEQAKTTPEPQK